MAGRNNRPVMAPAAKPQPAPSSVAARTDTSTAGLVEVTFIRDHQHADIDYVKGEIAEVSPAERDHLLQFGAIAPPVDE